MSQEWNALILFCEGDMDLDFAYLVLTEQLGFIKFSRTISECPYPLDIIISKSIENNFIEKTIFNRIFDIFIPKFILLKDNMHIALLFNLGGKDNSKEAVCDVIRKLSSKRTNQLRAFSSNDYITKVRSVFLYDMDNRSLENICDYVSGILKTIKTNASNSPWNTCKDNPSAAILDDEISIYVSVNKEGSGTLEGEHSPFVPNGGMVTTGGAATNFSLLSSSPQSHLILAAGILILP